MKISLLVYSFLSPGCINGLIRLIGGRLPSEGRVEVCADQQWGTVCDDFFDSTDAGVICGQLGFSRSSEGEHTHARLNNLNTFSLSLFTMQMPLHLPTQGLAQAQDQSIWMISVALGQKLVSLTAPSTPTHSTASTLKMPVSCVPQHVRLQAIESFSLSSHCCM